MIENQIVQEIRHILANIPEFNGADVEIKALGGLTNKNYRIDTAQASFVLRVGGKGTHLLGIDRQREFLATAIVADMGVGAKVIYADLDQDTLVTEFIEGHPLAADQFSQPHTLERIVRTIYQYHHGPVFQDEFSPFETVRRYYALAQQQGVEFPDRTEWVLNGMAEIESALKPFHSLRPCHNDLLAANFIDDGHTIRMIDWEYAAMGDPFFDLGNFAVNQSLDDEAITHLLTLYFGEARPADRAHLELMKLASDLRESFWGFLQSGISALDFDYQAYAHQYLDHFLRSASSPEFIEFLTDVKKKTESA